MKKTKSILLTILLIGLLLAGCTATRNYEDPDGPLFQGNYAGAPPPDDDTLKVVSYNVRFAENVEGAIQELTLLDELADADILLLQEMDDGGSDAIAKALGYNYVYYPATLHPRNSKNFGNAILSPWPITDPGKLVLPHLNPLTQQARTATKATVQVGDTDVLAYSVHTETLSSTPGRRRDQIDAIIDDIDPEAPYVVVGGDFNTATAGEIRDLEERFAEIDMIRASDGGGPTVDLGPGGFTLDHIFTRGMTVLDNGVAYEAAASDHLPLWVLLKPQ